MVLFVSQFLLILFVTSFKKYHPSRSTLLALLAIQIALELLLPSVIDYFLGVKTVRCVFMSAMGLVLMGGEKE